MMNIRIKMGRKKLIHFLKTEPTSLVMELSSFCNLKCTFCNFHGYEAINKGREVFASWDVIREIAKQLNEHKSITRIACYHSGEELLHPEWYEMVEYLLNQTHLAEFTISTNGMLLNGDNIEKFNKLSSWGGRINLYISLSGNTEAECELIRKNMNYEIVRGNIRNAIDRLSDKISIIINCDYMVDYKYLKQINFDYNKIKFRVPEYIKRDFPEVKSDAVPTLLFNPMMIPDDMKDYCIPALVKNKKITCIKPFNLISVDSSGFVLNCACNGGYHRLGNIMEKDMVEIWENSPLMVEGRRRLKKKNVSPEFCHNCCYQIGGKFYLLAKL